MSNRGGARCRFTNNQPPSPKEVANRRETMNITINTQILSGNLGDGWTDNNAAAEALANYSRSIWTDELAELIDEGHTIEIEIEVLPNTSGAGRDLAIDAETFGMVERVEGLLTDEGTLWERFCDSAAAADLWA